MSMQDPGRLPYKQLMREAERVSHNVDAQAELRAEIRAERQRSPRGLRQLLLRLRRVGKGRG